MPRGMARTKLATLLGLVLAVSACGGDASGPADTGAEPLDPLDGDDTALELGKGDGARRTLPPFDAMWSAYPSGEAEEVKRLIGGSVNADWITNTCTIRLSRALNYAGFTVPGAVPGLSTVRGGDGKRYAYRVAEMRRYLRAVLGPPTVVGTGADRAKFAGKKGLIMFDVRIWSDATGHFDLWDGSGPAHAEYFDQATTVQLWVAR